MYSSNNKSIIISITVLSIIVLLSSISTANVDALCGKKAMDAGPCKLSVEVCGHLKWFKWTWSGDAKELASGKVGHADKYKSKEGAGKNAVLDLFANKLSGTDCNCGNADIPVGKCTIAVNGCFYFSAEGDLTANPPQPSFRVTATNKANGHIGRSVGLKDNQEAGKAAVTDLFTQFPADGAECFSAVSAAAVSADTTTMNTVSSESSINSVNYLDLIDFTSIIPSAVDEEFIEDEDSIDEDEEDDDSIFDSDNDSDDNDSTVSDISVINQ